jgi:hypothetical protein
MTFFTVRKGHAKTFSSGLMNILLLKIPKVSNILRNSYFAPKSIADFAPKSTG